MTTAAMTEWTTAIDAPKHRFLFGGADWTFYEQVLRQLDGRRVQVTYDRGRLEILYPSWEHEEYGRFLGKLVPIIARALGLPYRGGGSTTFRRHDREAGLEPDQCFYIRNAPLVERKRQINLKVDPPPDLAIEIEVSRRLLARQDVYARLGVPELWRYDGQTLRVFRLGKSRKYRQVKRSVSFPGMSLEEVHLLLQKIWDVSESRWEDAATEWAARLARR